MNKIVGLVLSMAVILSVLGFGENASAYANGLLQGKSMYIERTLTPNPTSETATTTLLTDGNEETGELFYNVSSTVPYGAWYEFENAVSIDSYQAKAAGHSAEKYVIAFMDASGNKITESYIDVSGAKIEITPVENVKKIWIYWGSTQDNPGTLQEFDVFASGLESSPIMDVVIDKDKIKVGEQFTSDILLKNVSNIYAEDFKINYDSNLLNYVSFEEIPGYKIYNQPTDENGTLRFIIASQGEQFGINGEQVILKLKFSGKAKGTAKVDALACRIADTEAEYDLVATSCLEDTIEIEGIKDVNRTGEYTLVDLAIDGFYFGKLASATDLTIHDADQTGDEQINDDDLVLIVNEMLNNSTYPLNN